MASKTARQNDFDDFGFVDDDLGPDLLSDPTFVPCRVESCGRRELHREHGATPLGRKNHQQYELCPKCQTPVVVTKPKQKVRYGKNQVEKTRVMILAECKTCGWSHTKALKKD